MRVEFEFEPPYECTPEEAEEWVRYCLGSRGSMSANNPLATYDLEAEWVCML